MSNTPWTCQACGGRGLHRTECPRLQAAKAALLGDPAIQEIIGSDMDQPPRQRPSLWDAIREALQDVVDAHPALRFESVSESYVGTWSFVALSVADGRMLAQRHVSVAALREGPRDVVVGLIRSLAAAAEQALRERKEALH